ncbi:MAG: hypothetical protein ACO3ME_09350 [Ilumatobacteraceae bacterium]
MPLNPFTKGSGDIPISDGGTGASNAADARTNLNALNEAAHDLLAHQEALRRELRAFNR